MRSLLALCAVPSPQTTHLVQSPFKYYQPGEFPVSYSNPPLWKFLQGKGYGITRKELIKGIVEGSTIEFSEFSGWLAMLL